MINPLKASDIRPAGVVSPLYSFGQSIEAKGTLVLQEQLHYHKSNERGSRLMSIFNAYYGLFDRLTLIARVPAILKDGQNRNEQRGLADIRPNDEILLNRKRQPGLGDIWLNGEILLYRDEQEDYKYDITSTLGFSLPTATVNRKSRPAQKATNFFMGWTGYLITTQWYVYGASAAEITTTNKNFKFGNGYINDLGIGKVIFSVPHMYFILFVELDAIYHGSNKINGIFDFNSGEFFTYFGPTFRFKRHEWWIQGGIQWPVAGRAKNIVEERFDYRAAISFAYSF